VWIFDLDNTLHDAAARIFPSMHEQINAYLKRHFGVDDAGRMRCGAASGCATARR